MGDELPAGPPLLLPQVVGNPWWQRGFALTLRGGALFVSPRCRVVCRSLVRPSGRGQSESCVTGVDQGLPGQSRRAAVPCPGCRGPKLWISTHTRPSCMTAPLRAARARRADPEGGEDTVPEETEELQDTRRLGRENPTMCLECHDRIGHSRHPAVSPDLGGPRSPQQPAAGWSGSILPAPSLES